MATYPTAIASFTTKVDGVDYPLASHINSLQDEVVAVETALGINAKGVYSSTSAPVSPVAGQLFYDTDTAILWTYGTYAAASRWVSVQKYGTAALFGVSVTTAATIHTAPTGGISAGYDIYFDTLYFKHFVLTTNNGSNYWTCTLRKVSSTTAPAAGAGTSLGACNTSASSTSTWTETTASINAVIDFSGSGMEIPFFDLSVTGAPGNIWHAMGVSFRLVRP